MKPQILFLLVFLVSPGCVKGPETTDKSKSIGTRVIPVANTNEDSRGVDIVFLHGLMGDAKDTWQHDGDATFWPKWLGDESQSFGVWTVGYDASASDWAGSTMPLHDRAENIRTILKNKRIGSSRKVIFVTHSLGGLVVKQLLRNASELGTEEDKTLAKNTAAVVFLATPHAGSNEADFMKRLNSIFKVVRHTETIDELTFQNANLRNLDQWYSKYADANGISTLAFYEKNETFGHLIVDEGSANPHTRGSKDELVPVGANHLEISKPPNKEHIVYETTVRFLKSVLNYVAVELSLIHISEPTRPY